ncbi:uncharacterized protein LOC129774933 isoform X2 [Toxorhynchites rutilus septentrionalis]|nr:uncharacterized protein LOC129774933 isoform X2 [Toxorhynchites rutilus septentrionalis]
MGVASRKGRLYCCTRHFDIPGDFDGDASSDKSSGIRLKLRGDVLPHKGITFQKDVKNIYSLFDQMKRNGKLERNCKYLLPAIEQDLKIKVPLNIKPSVMEKTYLFLIEKINEYFKADRVQSRYQLVQYLNNSRDAITGIANEKPSKGTLQSSITLKTIQPFLQYDSVGCLDLQIDYKQLEQLYFVCESNQLNAYFCSKNNLTQPIRTDISHLFFTPGIGVHLTLPFFEISRGIIANSEKYVVDQKSILRPSETKLNGMEKFQKIDRPYRLKSSKVGQNATLEYLDILINLFESYEFTTSHAQRSALKILLQQIRKELSEYEMKELQVTYGYYLASHKYYRIINNDIKSEAGDENSYMHVKEVINPEVNFQFINTIDIDSGNIDMIQEYFRPVLEYVNEEQNPADGESYLRFADKLKKAIVYTCLECNATFDSHVGIEKHRFQGSKKWKCVICHKSFPENEIVDEKWKHECNSG